MTSIETRADRFVRELAELRIPDPAAGRPRFWQRLGAVLMVLGPVLGVTAYLVSHHTTSALVQGDAVTIGLGAVTVTITGSALFLRYSLTGFLRFWMARQSHELALLADRLDRDPNQQRDSNHRASAPDLERNAQLPAGFPCHAT
jgi:hypothetical protein